MPTPLALLDVADRRSWRLWLQENHQCQQEVWLVCWKVASGRSTLTYDDAVEEALCFGWIDSTVRGLDNERFARKFTPRKDATRWSTLNLKRFAKMKDAGLVTDAGFHVFAPTSTNGPVAPAKVKVAVPKELANALSQTPRAAQYFSNLAQSYRNQYIGWIMQGKRPETRARRIAEAVRLLAKGEKLGLK